MFYLKNQHPDPLHFIHVFRLLSFYSLVKSPSGSNFSGGEILNSLIHIKSNTEPIEKLKFENKLDE